MRRNLWERPGGSCANLFRREARRGVSRVLPRNTGQLPRGFWKLPSRGRWTSWYWECAVRAGFLVRRHNCRWRRAQGGHSRGVPGAYGAVLNHGGIQMEGEKNAHLLKFA
jgi:hypothetical protein